MTAALVVQKGRSNFWMTAENLSLSMVPAACYNPDVWYSAATELNYTLARVSFRACQSKAAKNIALPMRKYVKYLAGCIVRYLEVGELTFKK